MAERYALVFEGGPRAGERVPVSGDRFTLGRKPGNSLVIPDASVSGSHCELRRTPDGWTLKDLGSTNGTFYAGAKILEAKVRSGDTFAVGSVLLKLEIEGAAAAAGTDEILLGGEDEQPAAAPTRPAAAELDFVEDDPGRTTIAPAAARAAMTARTAPVDAPMASAGAESSLVTDAATVERARKAAEEAAKKGRLGTVALLGVAVVALGGAAYVVFGSGDSGGARAKPVPKVANNLVEQPAFEPETDGDSPSGARSAWDLNDSLALPAGYADLPDGAAGTGFSPGTRKVRSGARAIEAKLEASVARATSKPIPVSPGQKITFAAYAATGERAGAVVQAVFRSSKEGGPKWIRTGGIGYGQGAAFTKLSGIATVPTGCNEMQLSLVGFGTGTVVFDDAEAVVGEGGSEPMIVRNDIEFLADPVSGRVRRFDRDFLHSMGVAVGSDKARMLATLAGFSEGGGFTAYTPAGPALTGSCKLEPGEGKVTFRFQVDAGDPAAALAWHVDRAFAPEMLVRGATTRWSRGEFTETACSALVFGEQSERVRVSFEPAVAVKGIPAGASTRLEIAARGAFAATVQYSFDAERRRATELEAQADAKAAAGALGEEIALRAQILDEFPFEKALVERNESKRSERLSAGQKLVADVERRIEEARFFQVPDAFRKARTEAEKLLVSYAGTDIAERAKSAIARVDESLGDVEAARGEKDAERLATIARALEASGAKDLAGYLRTYLKQHFPTTKAAKSASGG
ncbi:MAG: FHA domain-containing protein [Planctomycetes bacterium]|nr:FHA domain-containing protein [Planctomycetota bacterium]